MTLFFYIVIALITFVAFLHAWSKKDFDVSRTIVINRSKDDVYGFVRQFKNQPKWVSWYKNDPKLKFKFTGEDGKLDAIAYWKSGKQIGEGTQKIIKVKPGKILETKILLVHPFKIVALNYIAVKEIDAERTKIVWGVRGYLNFPLTVIGIFYNMEKLLGADFDQGLKNLKHYLENNIL